jgi:hypothetical protein
LPHAEISCVTATEFSALLKLQAVLAEPFGDRPDIQEAIARAVAFLEERSLDRPPRLEDPARMAMGLGDLTA